MKKIRKSLILLPALAAVTVSAVGAATGTAAWFFQTTTASLTGPTFIAEVPDSTLKIHSIANPFTGTTTTDPAAFGSSSKVTLTNTADTMFDSSYNNAADATGRTGVAGLYGANLEGETSYIGYVSYSKAGDINVDPESGIPLAKQKSGYTTGTDGKIQEGTGTDSTVVGAANTVSWSNASVTSGDASHTNWFAIAWQTQFKHSASKSSSVGVLLDPAKVLLAGGAASALSGVQQGFKIGIFTHGAADTLVAGRKALVLGANAEAGHVIKEASPFGGVDDHGTPDDTSDDTTNPNPTQADCDKNWDDTTYVNLTSTTGYKKVADRAVTNDTPYLLGVLDSTHDTLTVDVVCWYEGRNGTVNAQGISDGNAAISTKLEFYSRTMKA